MVIFAGFILLLTRLRGSRFSLPQQILAGLVAGVAFGFYMQIFFAGDAAVMEGTLEGPMFSGPPMSICCA